MITKYDAENTGRWPVFSCLLYKLLNEKAVHTLSLIAQRPFGQERWKTALEAAITVYISSSAMTAASIELLTASFP